MQVAKTCYNPNPIVEHVQSVTDWSGWFVSNRMINQSVSDMSFNHAFRIKKFELSDVDVQTSKVLVHSKKLGYQPDKNQPKAWRPNGGVQLWYGLPEVMRLNEPVPQPIRALDLADFESLRKIKHGFERFFGNKFCGELKAYWESAVGFQEYVMEGNDTPTDYEFFKLSACTDEGTFFIEFRV